MVKHLKVINNLKIKIFADTANLKEISKLNKLGYISGYTTNPTIIRNNKISDYESFAKKMLNLYSKIYLQNKNLFSEIKKLKENH